MTKDEVWLLRVNVDAVRGMELLLEQQRDYWLLDIGKINCTYYMYAPSSRRAALKSSTVLISLALNSSAKAVSSSSSGNSKAFMNEVLLAGKHVDYVPQCYPGMIFQVPLRGQT